VLEKYDWNQCGRRLEKEEEEAIKSAGVAQKQIVFDGNILRLHGDMEHEQRKKNYFAFDKSERAVLICTDVASRGLDFKHVEWIV
jgi:superfamily II DNA/RNA helicase